MCQLLGMNCNVPTDILFSFEGFRARGGGTDEHGDGWGIAFFENRGCRLFIDSKASVDSPVADLVRRYPIHSKNVIAHIRKSTNEPVALENTHPFMRELWGRYWIFAHNGDLKAYAPHLRGPFRPVGGTDSEKAFCWLLEVLSRRFPDGEPPLDDILPVLADATARLARRGTFNFLLCNGEYLFAHCSTRLAYIVRQAPFAKAHLVDADVTVDFAELTTPADRVAVIATQPLTDNEVWQPMEAGQLAVFHEGSLIRTAHTATSPVAAADS